MATLAFLGFFIGFMATKDNGKDNWARQQAGLTLNPISIFLLVVMILAGVAYLLLSFRSVTWKRLTIGKLDEPVQQYLARMKLARPRLMLRCRCSHRELRSRVNSEGRSESYWETVVTYNGEEEFMMGNDMTWMDCTDATPLTLHAMTQVECQSEVVWGDDVVKARFEAIKYRFIETNKYRDDTFEYWDELDIDGFIKHALATPHHDSGRRGVVEADHRCAPLAQSLEATANAGSKAVWRWWVSPFVYIICTFSLLAWPYALLFDSSCDRIDMRFRKKACFLPSVHAQYPHPMHAPMQAPMMMPPPAYHHGTVPVVTGAAPPPGFVNAPMQQPMPSAPEQS